MQPKTALILPCSARKIDPAKLPIVIRTEIGGRPAAPAITVYDGNFFRIVRKYKPGVDAIFILSAKYGLIGAREPIRLYEQKLTKKRAESKRFRGKLLLQWFPFSGEYTDIYIVGGKLYREAFERVFQMVDNPKVELHLIGNEGDGIGTQQAELKDFCLNRILPDGQEPAWWPYPRQLELLAS